MCGMYNEQILFSDKVQSMHRNGFVRPKPTTALSCPMCLAQSKSSNKMMAMHCMYRLREDCLQLSYSPDHVTSLQCTTCFKSNQQPTWTLYMYKWCKSMQRNAGFGTCTILSTRKGAMIKLRIKNACTVRTQRTLWHRSSHSSTNLFLLVFCLLFRQLALVTKTPLQHTVLKYTANIVGCIKLLCLTMLDSKLWPQKCTILKFLLRTTNQHMWIQHVFWHNISTAQATACKSHIV